MEIIPVIHMINEAQVSHNMKTILGCGLKKFFLIGHIGNNEAVFEIAKVLAESLNNKLWVGVNLLGVPADIILRNDYPFNAVWSDTPPSEELERKYKGEFFGPLDFKYQPKTEDLETAARKAIKYSDVITTSGNATGKPPTIAKIEQIRGLIGNSKLAIASGINSDNITSFKSLVDYVLVASSITDSQTEIIIESKLKELISKI